MKALTEPQWFRLMVFSLVFFLATLDAVPLLNGDEEEHPGERVSKEHQGEEVSGDVRRRGPLETLGKGGETAEEAKARGLKKKKGQLREKWQEKRSQIREKRREIRQEVKEKHREMHREMRQQQREMHQQGRKQH